VATITAIRRGIAANLTQLGTNLGIQVSAYALANPTPPTIQVLPGEVVYDRAMHRGLDDLTFLVQALVQYGSDIGSQKRLDELLDPTGPKSLKTAVESDSTLGGIVSDVSVTNATGYRVAQGANGPILLCEWSVQVMAQNP
jgi:hypothetical protein